MLDNSTEVAGAACAFVGIYTWAMGLGSRRRPEDLERLAQEPVKDVARRELRKHRLAQGMVVSGLAAAAVGIWFM